MQTHRRRETSLREAAAPGHGGGVGAGPGGLGGPRPARAPAALKTGAVLAPAQAPVPGRSARAPAVASAARPDAGRRGVRVRKAAPAPGQTAQGQKTSLCDVGIEKETMKETPRAKWSHMSGDKTVSETRAGIDPDPSR